MTEQKFQKKISDQYTKDGWFVLKLVKTNKPGIPDLLCLKDGEKPTFIEVKALKGVVAPLQTYRIKELNQHGFNAFIKRSEV
tara:strand:+ start:418 stop:663 length:246 start_codon:yes stop_codon:yes gene_type:complete